MYGSGHGSCTFECEAGEELEISVYTRSTSGAKATVTDTNGGKPPFVENFLVKHNGMGGLDEIPTQTVITTRKIKGPESLKVKIDSLGGRWTSYDFLVVFSVHNA